MAPHLLFVLCAAAELPSDECHVDALHDAQRRGPGGGFALRLFTAGRRSVDDLSLFPVHGALTGDDRRGSDGCQLICDAVIPHFDPQQNWLCVYERLDGREENSEARYQCIDRFPLNTAGNETCWFYPTHDGTFLSWEQAVKLVLKPGNIVDPTPQLQETPYERGKLSLLWSLLADDTSLSCVGLTYGGQRIEWPLQEKVSEPMATWSRFCVDSQAEECLTVESSHTVFVTSSTTQK